MFERFTKAAREVVTDAQAEAHFLGAPAVGPEHLLLAVLKRPAIRCEVEVAPEALRRRLAASDPDAEALATLGISLAEVRRKVEEAFGPRAWDAPRRGRRLPFAKDAKGVLELALREALELKSPRLGAEHVLLGLLRERGPAWALLEELGERPERVQRALRWRLGRLARIAGR